MYRPLKYDSILKAFPTQKDAINFYSTICIEKQHIQCKDCECDSAEFEIINVNKPRKTTCKKCKKEFSIFKNSIIEGSRTDIRYWLYVGYLFEFSMRHEKRRPYSINKIYTIIQKEILPKKVSAKTIRSIYYKISKLYESEEISDYLYRDNLFYGVSMAISKLSRG